LADKFYLHKRGTRHSGGDIRHPGSAGQGQRPHPRFLRSRLRFCPPTRTKASQFTRQSCWRCPD